MQRPILTVPDSKLREKSVAVSTIDHELHDFLLDLEETLKKAHNPEGVALAAPQLGHHIRAFVTHLDRKTRFYVNPQLLDVSDDMTLGGTPDRPVLEGCLSIPFLYGPVYRPKKIKIRALGERGEEFTRTLTSFPARVFLHELDHLEGILFTDYIIGKSPIQSFRSEGVGGPLYLLESDEFVKIEDPEVLIKW